jgi:hypothetical protein
VVEKDLSKNKEALMRGRKIKLAFILFLTLFILPYFIWAQTSPEAFLKFKVGADRKLADYNQIMAYFQKLDQESGKVKVLNIGVSSENKPMIMAVITSEQNMGKLEVYRGITKKLRDPRTLSPEEAKKLAPVASTPMKSPPPKCQWNLPIN